MGIVLHRGRGGVHLRTTFAKVFLLGVFDFQSEYKLIVRAVIANGD